MEDGVQLLYRARGEPSVQPVAVEALHVGGVRALSLIRPRAGLRELDYTRS